MKKLLIGTSNQTKLNNYKRLLKEVKLKFVSPDELNIPPPKEHGQSFEEIAVNKAKYYFQESGLPSLVDDSGFEIDALNGEPGIKSHTWLGHEMSDKESIDEVIKRMKNVPEDKRQCHFTVVIALATHFGIVTSHAVLEGIVGTKPSSKLTPGYPYDSVHYLKNYGKFICELDKKDYDIVDHRRHAIEKINDMILEISKE
ncbi:MAG: non-canonical purine NTP pyrophosphatase [bacterium]|nr:non-canonical purine NTP pyrophosphatase [bacterium]